MNDPPSSIESISTEPVPLSVRVTASVFAPARISPCGTGHQVRLPGRTLFTPTIAPLTATRSEAADDAGNALKKNICVNPFSQAGTVKFAVHVSPARISFVSSRHDSDVLSVWLGDALSPPNSFEASLSSPTLNTDGRGLPNASATSWSLSARFQTASCCTLPRKPVVEALVLSLLAVPSEKNV